VRMTHIDIHHVNKVHGTFSGVKAFPANRRFALHILFMSALTTILNLFNGNISLPSTR